MNASFNLVEERWIPVASGNRCSLVEVFSEKTLRGVGGNPIVKISILKLLWAICQAAYTPQDIDDWFQMGTEGLQTAVLEYLKNHRDQFWLYGDHGFLQFPQFAKAKAQSYGALLPYIATGNTTILFDNQRQQELSDAERAELLVTMQGFAFGGKKVDNSIILTEGYTGKSKSGKAGTSLGFLGFLHSFFEGDSILETCYLNLLTLEDLSSLRIFPEGLGVPPWEMYPEGEDDEIAKRLKASYMGRLVPLCRFLFLDAEAVHYSEGLLHLSYKEGVADLTCGIDSSGKEVKAIWCDPSRRPWRQLPALLAFLQEEKANTGVSCLQLRFGYQKIKKGGFSVCSVWSGGVRVSSNAGEQYLTGSDDFVISEVQLASSHEVDALWYSAFVAEMEGLDKTGRVLYGSVIGYFKEQKADGKKLAERATALYWSMCEQSFGELVQACSETNGYTKRQNVRKKIAAIVSTVFNEFCPSDSARQLSAWARSQPVLFKYEHMES
ncbi:MAG: type I-E CRISPR-associated protein Cse1/CasA [Sphaerochaeta sp.]